MVSPSIDLQLGVAVTRASTPAAVRRRNNAGATSLHSGCSSSPPASYPEVCCAGAVESSLPSRSAALLSAACWKWE
jgi:hypothetical protein